VIDPDAANSAKGANFQRAANSAKGANFSARSEQRQRREFFSAQRTAPKARIFQRAANSAKGAKYDSQGQARSASPLVQFPESDPGLKGRNKRRTISAFQASTLSLLCDPGATRFALAPGYHISRLWRCALSGPWRCALSDLWRWAKNRSRKISCSCSLLLLAFT